MKLRKQTTIERAGISQEWREVVSQEVGVPEGTTRRIQIMVPAEPEIYLSHLQDVDKVYGVNRTYKGPPVRPNATVEIEIRSEQSLFMATKIGSAVVTVITEYIVE